MSEEKIFQASPEAKGKAKQLRMFAILAWIVAMVGQGFAIYKVVTNDVNLTWLIAGIVGILILAMTGSYLWKKANRLDPASEKDKTRFFIQNQLGAILGVLAFLPLVVMILTNKDMDGKTKGIAGAVAGVAMLVAGIQGVDFNPASIEKYTEEIQAQTASMEALTGSDQVYWSTAGNKYHIDDDCHHIRGKELSSGTIKESFEQKGLSELCKTCQKRAEKAKTSIMDAVAEPALQ